MRTMSQRGNPNFGRKKANDSNEEVISHPKAKTPFKAKQSSTFKLVKTYETLKPRDKDTGELNANPYPEFYFVPNSGTAYNEETDSVERWRFLHGYASIWEKDQQEPEPDNYRLGNMDGKNDIIFKQGTLVVAAHETAKLQALMVQDIFEGIGDNQLVPRPFVYSLVDKDKTKLDIRNAADEAYLAEKTAREISYGEMVGVAMALGINVEKGEDYEDEIRTDFIMKAKSSPKLFLKVYNDPKSKIKYLTTVGLSKGILKVENGNLSIEGLEVMSVRVDEDIAEQVAKAVLNGEEKAKKLYDTLKSLDL